MMNNVMLFSIHHSSFLI